MKAMLTSSLGGATKVDGVRRPSVLIEKNGLLHNLKTIWPDDARVLIFCPDPIDNEKNDSVLACLKKSFPMSGLSVSSIENCDGRTPETIEKLRDIDVLVLQGGHVPTENRFMQKIRLRERLKDFGGIIVAWSAGSMNCADLVYAGPEFEGEAIDPNYERWLTGLGITDIKIFPHYQSLKDDTLDGMRLMEEITYPDSMGQEFIALNDGSYILLEDGKATLYGEAYRIKDGVLTQICADGKSISL